MLHFLSPSLLSCTCVFPLCVYFLLSFKCFLYQIVCLLSMLLFLSINMFMFKSKTSKGRFCATFFPFSSKKCMYINKYLRLFCYESFCSLTTPFGYVIYQYDCALFPILSTSKKYTIITTSQYVL